MHLMGCRQGFDHLGFSENKAYPTKKTATPSPLIQVSIVLSSHDFSSSFPKAQELMLLVGAHRQKLVIDFGEKALGNKGIFFSFLHLKKRQIVRRTQPAQLRSRKMLNISMHM
jgi:hypothetical protein